MSLETLREQVEDLLEEVARERYLLLHDRSRRPRIGGLHAAASNLFDLSRISEVQRAVSESTGLEERRARLLLEMLVRGRAASVAGPVLDERSWIEAQGRAGAGEQRIRLGEVDRVLAETSDRVVRSALEQARLEALDEAETVVVELLARMRGVYQDMGHGTLVGCCAVLTELDLEALLRDGNRLLRETDGVYRDLLGWFLPRLAGADLAEATAGDLRRLEAGTPFQEWFYESDPLRQTIPLLGSSGVDPRAGGRIRVEAQASLPGGRAQCCVLAVPDTVVIVHPGRPGVVAHASALDALGCALHHAHTDAALPVEFRWLGDESVPLAVGRLLEGLMRERVFLRDRYAPGRDRIPEYLRFAALLELLAVRRLVALLEVAVAWGEGAREASVADRYVEAMGSATGVSHDRREALWAVDLPSRFARELRGHQLGAVLANHLRDRMDEDWYRNPRSAEVLIPMLREGRRNNAAEVGAHLGERALSFGPWLHRLDEALG